jgi:hypothetical protein
MSTTGRTTADPSTPSPRSYQQRLVVYVVWHPGFTPGADLARRLYDNLMRDSQQPIARGLGIPVYFRSAAAAAGAARPRDIPLGKAHHTAVVVLVDDTMVIDREDGWSDYVSGLVRQIAREEKKHRLLPVMLSDYAFDLDRDLTTANFIRPPYGVAPSAWPDRLLADGAYGLLNPISHELCRLLLGADRLEHDAGDYGGRIGSPVQVFISHAKKDGAAVAASIRNYVHQNLQLKTFFDVNDIPFGSEFARTLESSVDREHTAVLVVQTDEYSTREWCQREVLWAKKYERPVLIMHGVRIGEKCSFPYLGNAPTIRFDPAAGPELEKVLGQLLVEILRNIHFRQHFQDLSGLFELEGEVRALPQTPELLTLLELQSDPKGRDVKTIVYQEPPLGEHLLDVLRRFAPDLTVTTPILLLTAGMRRADAERPLSGRTIGLSLGSSPDLDRLGFHQIHLDDAAVEFARYLLESGATLAYGGDLRPGGFTEILRDLVWTYDASESDTPRLRGYLAWPIHQDKLRKHPAYLTWTAKKNRIGFEYVPRPADQDGVPAGPAEDRSPENLLVWARCLTAMREQMDAGLDARVLLGGKLEGYMGRYPGLAEEALLARRSGKPLYLAGGLGGCTRALIDALLGREPGALTEAYQFRDEAYRAMAARHNAIADVDRIDYASLVAEFQDWGLAGLCAANGLTEEENGRLFETPHVIEMVYLVLRGLFRVFGQKA